MFIIKDLQIYKNEKKDLNLKIKIFRHKNSSNSEKRKAFLYKNIYNHSM